MSIKIVQNFTPAASTASIILSRCDDAPLSLPPAASAAFALAPLMSGNRSSRHLRGGGGLAGNPARDVADIISGKAAPLAFHEGSGLDFLLCGLSSDHAEQQTGDGFSSAALVRLNRSASSRSAFRRSPPKSRIATSIASAVTAHQDGKLLACNGSVPL